MRRLFHLWVLGFCLVEKLSVLLLLLGLYGVLCRSTGFLSIILSVCLPTYSFSAWWFCPSRNYVFLAVQNSSIDDLVTDSLTDSLTESLTVLLLLTYKEQHQRLVTFETSDQRANRRHDLTKNNPADLWQLRHWLQFLQLRTWFHDNLSYLTIKSDTGQHSQFLRCFSHFPRRLPLEIIKAAFMKPS